MAIVYGVFFIAVVFGIGASAIYFFRKKYFVLSAKSMIPVVQSLRANPNVTWEDIFRSLNPTHRNSVHQLLVTIRQGKQFNPKLGLGVIETGFGDALSQNPNASLTQALQAAIRSGDTIEKFGH